MGLIVSSIFLLLLSFYLSSHLFSFGFLLPFCELVRLIEDMLDLERMVTLKSSLLVHVYLDDVLDLSAHNILPHNTLLDFHGTLHWTSKGERTMGEKREGISYGE